MWYYQLITLYCTVCKYYDSVLEEKVQRQSNNFRPKFTDQEAITLYLWGTIQRRLTVKDIYQYTCMHLADWFPHLPSYQAFSRRLDQLAPAMETLCDCLLPLLQTHEDTESADLLLDSMPILVAKGRRSSSAKVCRELCSKTYNSSRQEWYYGLKLHAVCQARAKKLPLPGCVLATTAKEHDLPVAKQMIQRLDLHGFRLFGDKAYQDLLWKTELSQMQITLCVAPKKPKGVVDLLPSHDTLATSISIVRQPIESFFNWLQQKTGIQFASKVRSINGLLLHTFGKLAAALCIFLFGFNS